MANLRTQQDVSLVNEKIFTTPPKKKKQKKNTGHTYIPMLHPLLCVQMGVPLNTCSFCASPTSEVLRFFCFFLFFLPVSLAFTALMLIICSVRFHSFIPSSLGDGPPTLGISVLTRFYCLRQFQAWVLDWTFSLPVIK